MSSPQAGRPSLADLAPVLGTEFQVQLSPASGSQAEQLAVQLEPEEQGGRTHRLEMQFMPHGDDLYFLQLFVLLPWQPQASHAAELARVLLMINANLPLPGFGMQEDAGWLYFRCIVPCGNRRLDPAVDGEAILASTWVAAYQVQKFEHMIEAAVNGNLTAADATARIVEILAAE